MSEKNINFVGQEESRETVEIIRGNFSEVSVDTPEGRTTIRGAIKEILRNLSTSTVTAFRMEVPGGKSEIFTSDRSSELKDDKGRDRELPQGAEIKPVYQGRAAV